MQENSPQEAQPDTSYDDEWALDDEASQESEEQTPELKTDDEAPAADESAHEEAAESSPEGTDTESAETGDDDLWSNATESQRAAYSKAENEYKAMMGRNRVASQRADQAEAELREAQEELNRLREQTREKSEYELQHPELFEAFRSEMDSRIAPLQAQQSTSETDDLDAAASAVLEAHPNAGDLMNSTEFNGWLASQPNYVVNAMESTNPADIISILDSYTANLPSDTPDTSGLDAISTPDTSSSQPDTRPKESLSAQEQYDAEWEDDSI